MNTTIAKALAAVAAVAVIGAPPAHADNGDQEYFTELAKLDDAPTVTDPAAAIATGLWICTRLAAGAVVEDEIVGRDLNVIRPAPPGFAWRSWSGKNQVGAHWVAVEGLAFAAEEAYCPQVFKPDR
jgi:hypothetical protein